jgi:hypothetical protein
LNEGRGWGDGCEGELKKVIARLRPALLLGWVESNCDVHGQVAYCVTELGQAALYKAALAHSGNGQSDHAAEPPEPDDDALEAYNIAYTDMIIWLDAQTNLSVDARGEIGEIPLSCAVWDDGSPEEPDEKDEEGGD